MTVYHGNCTSVTFLELGIEVVMDPQPGEWKNATWARERAWRQVRDNMTVELILDLMTQSYDRGHHDGIADVQREMRVALGLTGLRE